MEPVHEIIQGGRTMNFMLVGVGGQGTILASNVLADVGLRLGYDVKKAEIHGMSQRGGSVTTFVRWGKQVFSPIISKGEVDVLIAFEKSEALRYVENLRPGGSVLINDYAIIPVTVHHGGPGYPNTAAIQEILGLSVPNIHWVNGQELAQQVGNAKTANVVILGALTALLRMEKEVWLETLEMRLQPKLVEVNRKAFAAGFAAINALGS
jgi:indolepyruvate ferredoxin oxidoreductase, beta subunit